MTEEVAAAAAQSKPEPAVDHPTADATESDQSVSVVNETPAPEGEEGPEAAMAQEPLTIQTATASDTAPSTPAAEQSDAGEPATEVWVPHEQASPTSMKLGEVWVPHEQIVPRAWVWELFVRMDRNGTGQVSREELKRCLKRDPEVAAALKLPDRMTMMASQWHGAFERVYERIDTDKSGGIDWEELCEYFNVLSAELRSQQSLPPPDEVVEVPHITLAWLYELFVRMDRNGDGQIDRNEMIRFLQANPEDAELLKFPAKFRIGSKKHAAFEKAFKRMDGDGSAEISWEEFAQHFDIPPGGVQGLRDERPSTPPRRNASLVQTSEQPLVPEDFGGLGDESECSEVMYLEPVETHVQRQFEHPYRNPSSSAKYPARLTLPAGENSWNFWKASGSKFEGERVNGHECGEGAWQDSNGMSGYQGQWSEGMKHNQGTESTEDGASYTGAWKANRYDGKGKLERADGLMYDGDWMDHQRHGFGVQTYAGTGNTYRGEWSNDMREGWGELQWSDGDLYVGQFHLDIIHGKGTLSSSKGGVQSTYKGEFKNGRFERRLKTLGHAVDSAPVQMSELLDQESQRREMEVAALKIQKVSRCRKARKRVNQKRTEKNSAAHEEAVVADEIVEGEEETAEAAAGQVEQVVEEAAPAVAEEVAEVVAPTEEVAPAEES
eukprot:TRINITY_DN4034_c0_g1_i2.p1 TRINITY_DN4034_c0_g1~~TRINITY_DN4034_c0_g1_i2.p1  ORF type:complete len:665 (+),score=168.40 TRINITY_DN4034_c0_g1_i2:172-2166(+)